MVIINEQKYPFGPVPELRLSIVKRWGIVKVSREQSVAEHSYNVAVITKRLCVKMFENWREWYINFMVEAIEHDQDEVYTGDIPSPCKTFSSNTSPIVKLADLIEAYAFIKHNCSDSEDVKIWCMANLKRDINEHCEANKFDLNWVSEFMEKIAI